MEPMANSALHVGEASKHSKSVEEDEWVTADAFGESLERVPGGCSVIRGEKICLILMLGLKDWRDDSAIRITSYPLRGLGFDSQ